MSVMPAGGSPNLLSNTLQMTRQTGVRNPPPLSSIRQDPAENELPDLPDNSDEDDSLDMELATNMPTLALRRAEPTVELLSLRRSDTNQYESTTRPSEVARLLDTSRESERPDTPAEKSDDTASPQDYYLQLENSQAYKDMSDDDKAALTWRRFSESTKLDDAPASWRHEIEESFLGVFTDEPKSTEFLSSFAPLSTLLYKRALTLHRLLAYHDKKSGKTGGFLKARTGPEPLSAEMAMSFSKQDLHLAK